MKPMTSIARREALARTARLALQLPVAVSALGMTARAFAQSADFPDKTIRLLVPFSAGGAADVIARILASDMSASLGQSVIVENRPGASGNIAMGAVARASSDGYTLLMGSASIAINKALIKATPFDPQADFTPVSLVAMVPSVLLVPGSLPVATVKELIAYAKASPDTFNYGSNGVGTTQHLAAVMLGLRTGLNLNHVPYKGVDGLMPDLISGRIQMSFNNVASALPHLKSGALKALAMGLPERWLALPDVPTFAEAGLADFDVSSWVAVFAPADLAADRLSRLEASVRASIAKPETREKILTGGNLPVGGSAADLKSFLATEVKHWRDAIEASGATPS